MKFFKQLIVFSTIILLFWSCSENENVHQDCYTCTNTLTEYCISEGDNFYTSSVNGAATTNIPLNGEYWSDIRAELESDCDNAPQRDCFTCNDTNTTYCYLEGDDFYTTSVNNATPTETLLDGMSWEDIRFDLVQNCADVEEDCYTCNSTSTEYCYAEGDTFYTSTVNGNETQIDLNGESWQNIRAELENDCPSNQTASIVGTWKLVEWNGTSVSTTTNAAGTATTNSTQTGSDYDAFVTFSENPNISVTSGSFNINYSDVTTFNGVTIPSDYTIENSANTTSTWEINGDQIISTSQGVTSEPATITELTDTTLKLYVELNSTTNENGNLSVITGEVFQTYERQ